MALNAKSMIVRRDLRDPRLLWLKGILFLVLGFLSVSLALFLVEAHRLRVGALFVVTIWAFCRAYYFAFYVIRNYIHDDGRKYAGLMDLLRRLASAPRK